MVRARSFRPAAFCLVPLVLASLLLTSCGYALAGHGTHLPDYIKIIGVPAFVNHSAVPDIDRVLHDKVIEELSGRGRYRVVPEESGDAVLTVIINSVSFVPVAFDANRQASRIRVTVSVNVDFVDRHMNTSLWSNPAMSYPEEYDVTTGASIGDVTAFFGQDATALGRLAQNFARAVVVAMLETF
jgi:hypothetical protein